MRNQIYSDSLIYRGKQGLEGSANERSMSYLLFIKGY